MISRRRFVAIAGIVLLPADVAVAQPTGKMWRIGYLSSDAAADTKVALDAFRDSMRDLGYQEGRNLALEAQYANSAYDRFPGLIDDLARAKVDLLLTFGTRATLAAQRARVAVPIVFVFVIDPVGSRIVTSLTRPGGTTTGPSTLNEELTGKRLSLLREVAPKATQLAVLVNPSFPPAARLVAETRTAAKALGFQVQLVEASRPDELETAFAMMRSARAAALAVLPDSMLIGQGRRIVELTNAGGLPAITPWRQFPELGGLMSYGVNQATEFRRAAGYVDKILKGAKPADLPVEQPTRFELVINLKTAKALGISIPPALLARVDHMIQ